MLVDTGADYTLLPKYYAEDLGINLEKDCKIYSTFGVGGSETVYLLENILEDFRITFFRHVTYFSDYKRYA